MFVLRRESRSLESRTVKMNEEIMGGECPQFADCMDLIF